MSKKEIIVYKIGGSLLKDRSALKDTLKCLDINPGSSIFVHGGGDLIDTWMDRMNLEVNFVNGQRVTDEVTMDLVEMILSGLVNKDFSRVLAEMGFKSVGLSGRDAGLAEADFIDIRLGRVGEIAELNGEIITDLLDRNYVPVLSPVSMAPDGGKINVNADFFAARIAANFKAKKFYIITSTGGVLKDGEKIKKVSCDGAKQLINDKVATVGMIPKLQAAVKAVNGGVKQVKLLDYEGNKGTCIK